MPPGSAAPGRRLPLPDLGIDSGLRVRSALQPASTKQYQGQAQPGGDMKRSVKEDDNALQHNILRRDAAVSEFSKRRGSGGIGPESAGWYPSGRCVPVPLAVPDRLLGIEYAGAEPYRMDVQNATKARTPAARRNCPALRRHTPGRITVSTNNHGHGRSGTGESGEKYTE
jgi:hypothetical protein